MSMGYNLANQLMNVAWVSKFAAGLIGVMALSLFLKSHSDKQRIHDIAIVSGLILLGVWKSAILVLEPTLWVDSSLNLFSFLLSPGTEFGFYLGLVCAVLYFSYKLKRERIQIHSISQELSLGILVSFLVYYSIHWQIGKNTFLPWGVHVNQQSQAYQPVSVYQIIANLIFISLIFIRKRKQKKYIPLLFLFWFSITQLVISLSKFSTPALWGLSSEQLFFFILAMFGLLFGAKTVQRGANL